MPRSRSRLLLLLPPLLALTLFFVACGWKVWHFVDRKEDVWLAAANSFPADENSRAFTDQEFMPTPFTPGQLCVLGEMNAEFLSEDMDVQPLPSTLLPQVQAHYPGVPIKNFKKGTRLKNCWLIMLSRVEFHGKYEATCRMTWMSHGKVDSGSDFQGIELHLTRSPLPFEDSRWHIVGGIRQMITVV